MSSVHSMAAQHAVAADARCATRSEGFWLMISWRVSARSRLRAAERQPVRRWPFIIYTQLQCGLSLNPRMVLAPITRHWCWSTNTATRALRGPRPCSADPLSRSSYDTYVGRDVMIKRRRGCLVLFLVSLLLISGALGYVLTRPSARDQLNRLAELPASTRLSFATVQNVLLQQLPIGTSESAIYTFLERHGAVRNDHATRPDLPFTYSLKGSDNVIYSIVADDPHAVTFPCRDRYAVQFVLDDTGRLRDITIADWGQCL
jgi:hypothetical protein